MFPNRRTPNPFGPGPASELLRAAAEVGAAFRLDGGGLVRIAEPCFRNENCVRVQLHEAASGRLVVEEVSHNLVPTQGRGAMFTFTTYGHADVGKSWRYIGAGTGTTAPAAGDTALETQLLRKECSWNWTDVFTGSPTGPKVIGSVIFLSSEANGFVTEFGIFNLSSAGYMLNRAFLTPGQKTNVTAITKAANAQITSVGHGLSVGHQVKIENVAGMTEINGLVGTVQSLVDADNFTVDINSSGFSTYTSGGKWTRGWQKTTSYTMTVTVTLTNIA